MSTERPGRAPGRRAGGRAGRRRGRRVHRATARRLVLVLAACGVAVAGAVAVVAHGGPLQATADAQAGPGGPAPSPQEPVRLVALLPLTGSSKAAGQAMRVAAQMTVDDVNIAGGVLGRRLELDVVDDACDPETAVLAADDAVARGVVASVGGYCSRSVVPTLKIFDAAGVPVVLPAANSSDLLAVDAPGVFLLNPTVTQQARLAVPWLVQLDARSVVVVHDGSSYSRTLAQAVDAAARAPGSRLEPVGLLEATQGREDLGEVAAQVVASGAGAVCFTGFETDAVRLAQALADAGFTGTFMVGDAGFGEELTARGPALLGRPVYATVPPLASLGDGDQRAWAAELRRRTGQDASLFTLQIADAVSLVVDAVERAGSTEPTAVRAELAGTDGLELLTGPVRFDASRVVVGQPTTLVEMTAAGASALEQRSAAP